MRIRGWVGVAVASALASGADATVTGLMMEYTGLIGGRHVWSVYAVSTNPNNVLLSVIDHTVVAGNLSNVLHNDFGGGTWNPQLTTLPEQIANDSFVTVTGNPGSGTNLDPNFGTGNGPGIPDGAGWFNANPGSPILFTGGRIKIIQLATSSFLPGNGQYTGRLSIGYKLDSSSTTPLYALNMTYGVIPAPGALALLGVAAAICRRRPR